jgi:guanylate kinase
MHQGLLFIVSAPAGTGKTTLVDRLEREVDGVERCITYTTREPREGEKEGVDYFFVSKEDFERMVKEKAFFEHATVFGQQYGVAKKVVESKLSQGIALFLVIDTQGAEHLKNHPRAVSIFLLPPSEEALKQRLDIRKTESKDEKELRLSWASKEMAKSSQYDYNVVNEHLDEAFEVLKSIVVAERHKVRNDT